MSAPAYKRILLKLSGEALMGDDSYGINRTVIERIVAEIAEVVGLGVEVAIVIGGGNIFRGVAPAAAGMDRARQFSPRVCRGGGGGWPAPLPITGACWPR